MKLTEPVYVHGRVVDGKGRIQGKGGVTVCCVPDGDRFAIGPAVCSLKDNFSRAKGRELAKKRALENLGKAVGPGWMTGGRIAGMAELNILLAGEGICVAADYYCRPLRFGKRRVRHGA